MATVWIPSLLRPLTGGAHTVRAGGTTLLAVLDDIEARHPGVRDRLVDAGRIRPELTIYIDGDEAGLTTPVRPESEIHVVPAIAGGSVRSDG